MTVESVELAISLIGWAVVAIGNIYVLRADMKTLKELTTSQGGQLQQHTKIVTELTVISQEHERRITRLEDGR